MTSSVCESEDTYYISDVCDKSWVKTEHDI